MEGQSGVCRVRRTLGCQSCQEVVRHHPAQQLGAGAARGGVGLCAGLMWRVDVGSRKVGVQSLRVALAGLWGAGRGAQSLPTQPQRPTASVLVSKERSPEGTYALLFLGD